MNDFVPPMLHLGVVALTQPCTTCQRFLLTGRLTTCLLLASMFMPELAFLGLSLVNRSQQIAFVGIAVEGHPERRSSTVRMSSLVALGIDRVLTVAFSVTSLAASVCGTY